ncbi:MAG: cation diffusion facilitator family transporter [Chroococcus sp. CMT-3BRIN-NPC107]|nr:cation diffusion facilitator family transporter [Chroococcus sp. CMT-3BRIN-NPC107]
MAFAVKQDISYHRTPKILSPCCDYSELINIGSNTQKTQLLWFSVILIGIFFVAELATGLWSGSLALQADAGHLLSDISSLGLALVSKKLAHRPANHRATFGHQRVEVLAALANSITLTAIALSVAWEAVSQLLEPTPVMGMPMLLLAGVGLLVNSLNIALLYKASQNDLNLRGVFLHMVADAASFVGVILAAIAIYFLNWLWVDGVVGLLVACFLGWGAFPILKESWAVLMEYAPNSINLAEVETAFKSFDAVEQVEKLHIWTISSHRVALVAHLNVNLPNGIDRDRLLGQLKAHLKQEFDIGECTLQLTSRTKESFVLHPLLNSNLIELFDSKQH